MSIHGARIDEWGDYHSPNVCFGGGGSSPAGQTTSVQQSGPWPGQIPFLQGGQSAGTDATVPGVGTLPANSNVTGVLPAASELYSNYTPQYFQGTQVAPLTPQQQAGIGAEFNYGAMGGSPAVNAATGFETNLLNGGYLNPTTNPNWQSMANTVMANTVPGLESQFTQGNTMNSPAAAYAVSQGANDALGNLAAQQYGNTLNLMNSGAAWAAPGLQGANLGAIGAMQDAGSQLQNQQQNQIDAAMQQWNWQQMLPYNQLNAYSSIVNGGNYGGTTNLSQPFFSQGSNTGGEVMQGLATAAMLAAVLA